MSNAQAPVENVSGPVFRLIYRSHSRIGEAARTTELGSIFTTARTNNQRLGVTGALVITEDAFAQVLEGEEATVRGLYESISQDPRHDSVALLGEETVDGRTFGRCSQSANHLAAAT